MPRAATPAAEQQRRLKISATMRGRCPVAQLDSHTDRANARRAASLRAYWLSVPDRRAAMGEHARHMAERREARKADAIERAFAAALARIKGGTSAPAPARCSSRRREG